MNPWDVAETDTPEPQGPFEPVTLEAMRYLAHNMRPADQEEIYNWIGYSDPERFAAEAYRLITEHGRGRIVMYEGKPAAWIATIEMVDEGEGIWQVSMGGTVFLTMVAYHCMAWARWTCRETKHNGRILYCDSREGHGEAHKFLLALGAKCESEVRIGHDGGRYYRFYWRYGENDEDVSRADKPNYGRAEREVA